MIKFYFLSYFVYSLHFGFCLNCLMDELKGIKNWVQHDSPYDLKPRQCQELKFPNHGWSAIDKSVSEHLRTQMRFNSHKLFLLFWSSKNMFSPSANTPNVAKISQFSKEMGKIWDVWCKGVQCLRMSDWKTD